MRADRLRECVVGSTPDPSFTRTAWKVVAVMESFFSPMEIERCHWTHHATREAGRVDLSDYIERSYNPIRRHSTLGNRSPINFGRAAVA